MAIGLATLEKPAKEKKHGKKHKKHKKHKRLKNKVPTARQLHLLTRFGAGFTPKGFKELKKAGGHYQWFEKQLKPAKVKENATAKQLLSWFPALSWSVSTKLDRDESGAYMAWEHARDLGNLSLLRRMYSRRQVLEQLTDFWSNHFHIPGAYQYAWVQRKPFDDVLRAHALGRFEDLLVAATLHPAMLFYLDNWTSVKDAPNENHGRELLELHTVGRDSGYTEAMVKSSARILSGYTVSAETATPYYDPGRHTTGRVTVLGFTSANASSDGRGVTLAYLKYLAHHPSTANRIARKLAVRFVSDAPSAALVKHLAKVYLKSGTDISEVLRAMVRHPDFWASKGKKVRTPYDDLIATCRALGVAARKPTSDNSFANALNWVHGSVLVYQWPNPAGAPEDGASWSSVSRMLTSFRFHWSFAGGWWPTEAVGYHKPTDWLPAPSVRFDALVDHLSLTWLGTKASAQLLSAACQAVDAKPATVINADHAVMRWLFPRLTAVFLDSPRFMSR